jgi:hypothetical protein
MAVWPEGQRAEASTLTVELIAQMWRDHAACNWISTGYDVIWSCGIIHRGPIHMQPTTRDRHLAALVVTQIEAERILRPPVPSGHVVIDPEEIERTAQQIERRKYAVGEHDQPSRMVRVANSDLDWCAALVRGLATEAREER